MAIGSGLVYAVFLSVEYEESQAQIGSAQLPEDDDGDDEGLTAKVNRWLAKGLDMAKEMGALTMWAENFVEHIVRLAAVLIVQTVVFPLIFLWGVLRMYRVFSAAAAK